MPDASESALVKRTVADYRAHKAAAQAVADALSALTVRLCRDCGDELHCYEGDRCTPCHRECWGDPRGDMLGASL